MCKLAVFYDNGNGVEKDPKKVVEWYRKAADKGNALAMRIVGLRYENGWGVEKDSKQAVEWYRKAAEKGDAEAMRNLGICYFNGSGVEKDAKQAADWYRKAAEKGNARAMDFLGDCYRYGKGETKDDKQAFEWFQKSADKGHDWGMADVGECYYNGFGVAKDERLAFEWFCKAAEKGHASSMLNLADCYRDGEGKDVRQAYEWYSKALASGKLDPKRKELAEKQIKKLEPIVRAAEKATAEAADLAEKAKSTAKKFAGETLVLKSFYAGMPKEDAEALCKSYLGLKRGEEISKACGYENGNLKELVLSRADIDKLFSVSGVSCEVFAKKLLEAYPIIGEFEVKTEEVPDVERQEKTKKSIEAKWQARALGIGGGFDTGYKMGVEAAAEYDRIKDSITKFAKVYRCESKKGFLLEIHDGLTDRFLVLRKTSVINMSNFD